MSIAVLSPPINGYFPRRQPAPYTGLFPQPVVSPWVRPGAYTAPVQVPLAQPTRLNPWLPRTQNPAFRFAVIGDAGTGDDKQMAVARQLSGWRQWMPFNSVMALGDNVYQNGEPALFQERIYRPYQDLFQHGVKFYPVMGNHDVKQGFGNWQLAYWGVPPFYNYKLGPKGAEVEFWAIDTNLLTPDLEGKYQANPWVNQQKADSQMQWLAQSLASSTAPMKVVYGHHPLYSRGAATKPVRAWQQAMLAQRLEPLLQQYGVDLYMSGHEHHYEKPVLVNGVYHLVSGAGGKLDTPKRGGPEGNGLIKQLHFMLFDITPQGLTYQTISGAGNVLDSGFIPNKAALGQRLSVQA